MMDRIVSSETVLSFEPILEVAEEVGAIHFVGGVLFYHIAAFGPT